MRQVILMTLACKAMTSESDSQVEEMDIRLLLPQKNGPISVGTGSYNTSGPMNRGLLIKYLSLDWQNVRRI